MPGKSTADAKQKAAALLARARQGDQAAIAQLQLAASPTGWRQGNRNAAIDAWNQFTPGSDGDLRNISTSHGFLGDAGEAIGKGMKFAAPFAGLIPGVGPLVGAGLAAGGSALGGALNHEKFNLLDTALAGGAGYLGGKANPFGGKPPVGALGASGAGNATQGMAGASQGGFLSDVGNAGVGALPEGGYQAFPGIGGAAGGWTDPGMSAGAPAGGSGGNRSILDRVLGGGGGGGEGGGGWLDKILQYGPLVAGGISNANRQHESDQMMQNAIRGSTDEWNARAPLRQFAQQGILGLPTLQRPDLSAVFADPGNRYG